MNNFINRELMVKSIIFTIGGLLMSILSLAQYIHYSNTDPRLVSNGSEIPSRTYADQPYVIVCDDGSWLCIMTTSSGTEQAHMNNIISTRSYDQGKTWTTPVNVESPGTPQSSWAVPLKVPGGRIYVFYNYNKYGFTGIEGVMSGPFMYKYSDDQGKTWSKKRYEVPIRKTKIDEENYTKGKYQFFWSIDKPVVTDKAAYITFTKILRTSPDQPEFCKGSEGFILKSENIIHEKNPEKISWVTLPEGERGIWNPDFGIVQAEHNMVILNNGNLYVTYRTINGSPAYAISADNGKTFSKPEYMHYANGNRMGTPRACPKIYKTGDGNYLFWFHNNFRQQTFNGRNPAWLSGGIEKNGDIVWSQPEIVLYDRDPAIIGMSYPDYFEQGGHLWITETQKNEARVHEINLNLVQGMWDQGKDTIAIQNGLIMDCSEEMLGSNRINFPSLPNLFEGGGFSIEFWMEADTWEPDQVIFSTFGPKNKGIEISTAKNNSIKLRINDGEVRETEFAKGQVFLSDSATISPKKLHHVVFIVDGASKILSIMVDGVLSDGSPNSRPYGWGRIYPLMQDFNDTHAAIFDPSFKGKIYHMRVYDRYLRTSEVIANYNAGIKRGNNTVHRQ